MHILQGHFSFKCSNTQKQVKKSEVFFINFGDLFTLDNYIHCTAVYIIPV